MGFREASVQINDQHSRGFLGHGRPQCWAGAQGLTVSTALGARGREDRPQNRHRLRPKSALTRRREDVAPADVSSHLIKCSPGISQQASGTELAAASRAGL